MFLGGVLTAVLWAEEGMWGRDDCNPHPRILDWQKTVLLIDNNAWVGFDGNTAELIDDI